MELVVRRACATDVEAIDALLTSMVQARDGDDSPLVDTASLAYDVLANLGQWWVATTDDAIVGALLAEVAGDPPVSDVRLLLVADDVRDQGVGVELYRAVRPQLEAAVRGD